MEVQYLAGLFDGEGCVAAPVHKGRVQSRRAAIYNTDRGLLDEAQKICESIGIVCKQYKCSTSKAQGSFSDTQVYQLVIYGQENLWKFYEKVPFRSEAKRERFKEVLDSYIRVRKIDG